MPAASLVPAHIPLVFVLPGGSELPSGGNVYNHALQAALAALVPVRRFGVGAWRAELERGAPGLYFLDSLDLNEIGTVARRADQYFGLVVHHLPSLEPGSSDRERLLEAALLGKFDLFLCTSPFTSALLRNRGVAGERLLTVPPAPPAIRASARRYEPPLRALVVANLIPRKGVLSLLEVLARRAERADFRLVVVGRDDIDPAYAQACYAAVRRSNYLAERVRLRPPVLHERMLDCYETADLLLSPATMETFGMAIQEARAHGLPVIVRDGGFAREHVREGVNGSVVFDDEGMVDVLLALAGSSRQMSELSAGAERTRPAAGFGWSEAAESFLAQLGRENA